MGKRDSPLSPKLLRRFHSKETFGEAQPMALRTILASPKYDTCLVEESRSFLPQVLKESPQYLIPTSSKLSEP